MAAFSALALGLSIAGATTSAIGQIRAGRAARRVGEAQQRSAESQAELADYNAAVADLQAKDALDRGQEEEQRWRQKVRLMVGEQRAGQAASNVDVGYGSAVDVQADTAFLGELDAMTIRNNAAREAWGYKVAGEDLRRRAQIARKEGVMMLETGRAQQSAYNWGTAGTLLGTGSSLLMTKYGFGKKT